MRFAVGSLILSLLILVGCTGPRIVGWQLPHGNQIQTNQDTMRCQMYAIEIAKWNNPTGSIIWGDMEFNKAFVGCMQGSGYTPVVQQ